MKTENKVGIGCLTAFGAFALFVVISLETAGPPEPEYDPWSKAQSVCEDHVLGRLKSPSSAEFGSTEVTTMAPYTVTGVVDAQNSFGATLRSSYTCTVSVSNGGWRLVSLDVS
jgi:hypothetical protein